MGDKVKSVWALQDAKNGFSRVVDLALKEGPQTVTRHGRECVVILSSEEYRQSHAQEDSLVDFFRKSPLRGVDLQIARSKDVPREVAL